MGHAHTLLTCFSVYEVSINILVLVPVGNTSPKRVVWIPHYVTVTQVCGFVCVWQSLNLVFVQSRALSHVGATRVL